MSLLCCIDENTAKTLTLCNIIAYLNELFSILIYFKM